MLSHIIDELCVGLLCFLHQQCLYAEQQRAVGRTNMKHLLDMNEYMYYTKTKSNVAKVLRRGLANWASVLLRKPVLSTVHVVAVPRVQPRYFLASFILAVNN
jgi:hypothetical protein